MSWGDAGEGGGGGGGGGVRWAEANATWRNLTLEAFLEERMGPQHLPLAVVLPVSTVYAIIFVSGVVGNVAVCSVIIRVRELHTSTNYYLFSLAVSDLALLLLGLPNEVSIFWQQYPWPLGEPLCKFRAVVSEMVSYTSVLTIVAFSTERYLAICHPLYAYSLKGLRRALLVIGAVWLVGLGAAAPFGAFTHVSYIDFPPGSGRWVAESAFCAMLQADVPERYPVYELSSVFFFALPMVALLVLYARMAAALWGTALRFKGKGDAKGKGATGTVHRRGAAHKRSVIKMLAAVVAAFFVCWAPFHLQRLLYVYASDSALYGAVYEVMFFVTGALYYFSSTVNPILYNVMSARYRLAFRRTLCGCVPGLAAPARARHPSSFRDSTGFTHCGSVYDPQRRLTTGGGGSGCRTLVSARLSNGAGDAGANRRQQSGRVDANDPADPEQVELCANAAATVVFLDETTDGANCVARKHHETGV